MNDLTSVSSQELCIDKKDVARIDSNMSDISGYLSHFGADQNMIMNVMYYLSIKYQSQTSMFGDLEIDPYDFSEMLNLKASIIRKPHNNPYQKRNTSESLYKEKIKEGQELFNTLFEDALYQLAFNSAEVYYRVKNEKGEMISRLEGRTFLKTVTIVRKQVGRGKKKKFYYVTLSDDARSNITGNFLLTVRNEFSKLSGSIGAKSLYFLSLDLKRSAIKNHTKTVHLSFDKLASCCKVSGSVSDRKKSIGRIVKKVNDNCPSVSFKLKWVKNGVHNYKPEFHFNNLDTVYTEKPSDQFRRFEKFFEENLDLAYKKLYPLKSNPRDYELWKKNSNEDISLKREVYMKSYNISFGKVNSIDVFDERIRYWLENRQHKFVSKI